MPTGGSSGEYKALYTAYSSNAANFMNAFRSVLSGGGYSGTDSMGTSGLFWSSTYKNSSDMYYLVTSSYGSNSNYVYPDSSSNSRNYGYSVRCVLK